MAEFINAVDLSGYTQRGEPGPVRISRGGNGKVLNTVSVGKDREVDVVLKVQQ